MLTNVTFSLDPFLLKKARGRAAGERTTLNALFRQWVSGYVNPRRPANDFQALMKRLDYADAGRKFSREEMNER